MYRSACGVCSYLSFLVLARAAVRKLEFQDIRLDDLEFTESATFTISQVIKSALDCGRQCTNNYDCNSFTVSIQNGHEWCRGHSVADLEPSSATSALGARTYRMLEVQCKTGWLQFQNSCYAVGDKRSSWAAAEEFCRQHDSSLAEVGSMEENEFLKSLARNASYQAVWLGGTDALNEGQWIWTGSREPINVFTSWEPGEPSSTHDGEDCLQLLDLISYNWNDGDCSASHPHFVCETRQLFETTIYRSLYILDGKCAFGEPYMLMPPPNLFRSNDQRPLKVQFRFVYNGVATYATKFYSHLDNVYSNHQTVTTPPFPMAESSLFLLEIMASSEFAFDVYVDGTFYHSHPVPVSVTTVTHVKFYGDVDLEELNLWCTP